MLHKFNTLVRLCIVAFLVIPFPVLADHVPTQPPYNQSIAIDTTTGDITIGIYTSDGWEDSPPEKYTIFFDIDNDVTTNSFCVSTSFGHTGNLQWNYHTFSLSDLQTYFANPYGNFRTKIRSDNDTDNSFSTLTAQMAIDIPNQEPFVGVENWSEPTTTCNDTSTTTTTSSTLPPTTEAAAQEEIVEEETTTTSSTTTTTEPPPPPPPPPPPTTTTTLYVVVNDDGSTSEYTESEVKDGTVDRDNERKANDEKWSCYMTNAQLDRGDCNNYNDSLVEEEVVEEKEEEVIIEEDEKEQPDTEEVISDDDVVVPEVVVEDKDEDPIDELEEEVIEDELDQEIPGDDIFREDGVQEEDDKDQDNKEEEIKEEEEVEETEEILLEPEEESEEDPKQEFVQDSVELTEEEVAIEVAEVEDIVEEIIEVEVKDLETEQVIEVLTEVADVGVENLTEVSEDVLEVVSEVIQEVITIATEEVLTEEQVEVVQEVLNLEEPEDVQIIAEAVKEDEAVAEAVEEYVERAVENADVEDYNLADVVTEIQTEEFLADPVGAFTDIDIAAIDLTSLGDTMTSTQKEKAQEVVVPVIIASQIVASVQVVPVRIRRRV